MADFLYTVFATLCLTVAFVVVVMLAFLLLVHVFRDIWRQ